MVPAFQLTDAGGLRPELLRVLLGAPGLDGWAIWSWLTAADDDVDGESPERAAVTDPARALAVATRFATASEKPTA